MIKRIREVLEGFDNGFMEIITYIIKYMFLAIAIHGLFYAVLGTTETNYEVLKYKFPDIAYSLSLAFTLVYMLPIFLSKQKVWLNITAVLVLIISANFAIIAIGQKSLKEIKDQKNESMEYNNYFDLYNKTLTLQEKAEDNISLQTKRGYEKGARGSRERAESVNSTGQTFLELLLKKEKELSQSISERSFQRGYMTLIQIFPSAAIISPNFFNSILTAMLAFTNDLMVAVYSVIIKLLLGNAIMIKVPEKQSIIRWLNNRIDKASTPKPEKIKPKKLSNDEIIQNTIQEYKIKPNGKRYTLAEIGKIAAKKAGRKKPFGKSHISQIKKRS